MKRLLRRSNLKLGSVVATDVLLVGSKAGGRNETNIGTLVVVGVGSIKLSPCQSLVEVVYLFTNLVDDQKSSVIALSEAQRGKIGSILTIVSGSDVENGVRISAE